MWHIEEGKFDLLSTTRLPDATGSVVTLSAVRNQSEEVYVATGYDQVIRCLFSKNPSIDIVLEGASSEGVVKLAVHPHEQSFFTVSNDNLVCKWHPLHGLEWKTRLKAQGMSVSVHPSGKVLAIGCLTGEVVILTETEGTQLSLLPISETSMPCLSFSPSGETLACGSSDGMMYLLPVSDDGLSYRSLSVLKVGSPFHPFCLSFVSRSDGLSCTNSSTSSCTSLGGRERVLSLFS